MHDTESDPHWVGLSCETIRSICPSGYQIRTIKYGRKGRNSDTETEKKRRKVLLKVEDRYSKQVLANVAHAFCLLKRVW